MGVSSRRSSHRCGHPGRDRGATPALLVGWGTLNHGEDVARSVPSRRVRELRTGQIRRGELHHPGKRDGPHVIRDGRIEAGLLVCDVRGLRSHAHGLLGWRDGLEREAPGAVVLVVGRDKRRRGRVLQAKRRHRGVTLVGLRDGDPVLVVLHASKIGLALHDLLGHARRAHGHLLIGGHAVHLIRHGHRLGDHLGRGHGIHGAHDGGGGLGLGVRVSRLLRGEGRGVGLLGLGELLEQRLGRVELEGEGGLVDGDGGGLLAHLLPLEIPLEGIEKEAVVGHAVPVEDLLLLLGPDAVVLVEEVQEAALGLFQRGIGAGLQVSQIGEDALLELLGVLDGAAEGLEAEGQASHDVGAGDVEEIVP